MSTKTAEKPVREDWTFEELQQECPGKFRVVFTTVHGSETEAVAAADEISVRKNVSRETRTRTSSGPLRSLLEHVFRAEEISCNRLRLAADPPKQTRVWLRNYLTSL